MRLEPTLSTRRQVLEAALVAERVHLWNDLENELRGGADPLSGAIENRVCRIRACCEALGYVTDWRSVPTRALLWYRLVETIPQLGLYPAEGHWADLLVAVGGETEPNFHEVSSEVARHYDPSRGGPLSFLELENQDG